MSLVPGLRKFVGELLGAWQVAEPMPALVKGALIVSDDPQGKEACLSCYNIKS